MSTRSDESIRTDERIVVTVDEAAKLLGISRGLAFEAARTGELPVIRIGRRMLVSRERLVEMLRTAGPKRGRADRAR